VKFLAARVVFVLVLLGLAGSRAQSSEDYENLGWIAEGPASLTLILEHIRSFDGAFKNAYPQPLTNDTTEIVIRSGSVVDTDGNPYRPSLLVTASFGQVVLTFLNLEGDLPDLNAPLLTSRLFKSILQLMDANFKRVPQP
jgi:hypothetical protein